MGKGAAVGKPFKLSKEARRDLISVLRGPRRRFDADAVLRFVDAIEHEIQVWQKWRPAINDAQLAGMRRAHVNLVKHLAAIQSEWAKLPDWYLVPFWREYARRRGQDDELDVFDVRSMNSQARESLLELLRAFSSDHDEYRMNCRKDARKHALVVKLVEAYAVVLGKMPTSTANGPFMDVMAILGEAMSEPIGKDAIQEGIAAYKDELKALALIEHGD